VRMLTKVLTTLGVTAALTATGTPAFANHQCQPTDLLCVITPATTIPAGTPVVPATGSTAYALPVAAVCLPTCQTVYVIVPGAVVSSTGATLVTITLPEYGVRVDAAGFPSVHGGIPTVSPAAPGSAGLELFVQVPYVPVVYGPIACAGSVPITVGPVTAWLGGCKVNARVTL
jgi:hypothetical protein